MLASLESLVTLFTRHNIMSGFYYAVAKGRRPGIYHTWDECKEQVHKFPGPKYKKFPSAEEAQAFINANGCLSTSGNAASSSTTLTKSRATPVDLVRLGAKEARSKSKRVWNSGENNENATVASAKRKKPATSNGDTSSSGRASKSSEEDEKMSRYYDVDRDGFVIVYTDGACSSNGYRGAKAGVGVFFRDNSPMNLSEPVVGRATNNMAEIQAVTRAAEIARDYGVRKLAVHTDSEFLIKCITQWMDGWKRRGWMTAANKPVINKEELQEMEAALEPLNVRWVHVRGHQGNYGNEMADKLARQGAERY